MRFPLGLFVAVALAGSVAGAEGPVTREVAWTGPDDIQFQGKLFLPAGKAAGGWVLLHGLGSVKEEWDGFAFELARSGQAALAFDLRGHGASTATRTGRQIRYADFRLGRSSPWQAMVGDIPAAMDVLSQNAKLAKDQIGLGGASLGANLALAHAALRAETPAVFLLSPGMEYAGIEIEANYKACRSCPLFMAASPGDLYAFSTVQRLARWRKDPKLRVSAGRGSAHGVQMLDAEMTRRLIAWTLGDQRKSLP